MVRIFPKYKIIAFLVGFEQKTEKAQGEMDFHKQWKVCTKVQDLAFWGGWSLWDPEELWRNMWCKPECQT